MRKASTKRSAKLIFADALRITDLVARQSYVVQACGDDSALRRRVEELLAAYEPDCLDAGHNLLDKAVQRLGPPRTAASSESGSRRMSTGGIEVGHAIGPYKIREQLAEGGMGIVYVAEQLEPVQRLVALKIIKPGMDSRQVIARFEAERQALAMMDHPNIAKVLDGGTVNSTYNSNAPDPVRGMVPTGKNDPDWNSTATDSASVDPLLDQPTPAIGRPYFVMELVRGLPITEFCDHHRLSAGERLKLFITVCRAVQHAHLKGVIHRDIKPSNVLVEMHDVDAVPKVIDFGVAKAIGQRLIDRTIYTNFAQLIGTPLYMSPEQAEMSALDVDTRSDVYSLGVLLYEILTGTTPFDGEQLQRAGFDEIRRIIRDVDPPRPSYRVSTLSDNLASTISERRRTDPRKLFVAMKGEVDWIVMKALEKNRSRRYESAGALADDVHRYLKDDTVQACPPSGAYRFRKYATRHKTLLTTAILVFVTALVGLSVSFGYATKANIAAERAKAAQADAERKATEARRAKQRSQSLLYVADMKLASDAIANSDAPRAAELLQRHLPSSDDADLRGFEWHLYNKLVRAPENIDLRQAGWVGDVKLSPDGRWLTTTSGGDVLIYDTETWSEESSLSMSCESVNGVAWSRDSQMLAAACDDGLVHIWNVASETQTISIAAHDGETNDVAFSLDGQTLYSCGDDGLAKSWVVNPEDTELGTMRHVFAGHGREVERIALSADGELLATASSDSSFAIWDSATAMQRHRFEFVGEGRIVCVAFAPEGRYVAAAGIRGYVYLLDLESGSVHRPTKQSDGVEALSFFERGQSLATADRGGAIHLYSVAELSDAAKQMTVKPTARWLAHDGRAIALTASGDGQRLISGGRDGVVRVWTPDRRAWRWSPYRVPSLYDFASSQDDQLYLAGYQIHVLDLVRRSFVTSFAPAKTPWQRIACSGDSRRLAAVRKGELAVFDLAQQELLSAWQLDEQLKPHRLAIGTNGRKIALAEHTERDSILLYDLERLHSVQRLPASQCDCLAFSSDGRWLAAGHQDDLRVFDLQNQSEFRDLQGHSNTLSAVSFSPDNQLVATVAHDRFLKVWRVSDGSEIYSVVAHPEPVKTVAFSPDGLTIATAGYDRQVKFWHAATGQPLGALPPEQDLIPKVAFSETGTLVALVCEPCDVVAYDSSQIFSNPFSKVGRSIQTTNAEFQGLFTTKGSRIHESIADGLSRDGMLFCGHAHVSDGFAAYLWSAAEGMHFYDVASKTDHSQATAVSADGKTLCGSGSDGGKWRARRWTAPGEWASIAPYKSHAEDMSADGQTVVGWHYVKTRAKAFRWESNNFVLLGPPPTHQHAKAIAITPSGDTVLGVVYNVTDAVARDGIHYADKLRDVRPVLWNDAGVMRLPSGFDSNYNYWSTGFCDDGSVIVGIGWPHGQHFYESSERGSGRAFRWQTDHVALLDLLPGRTSSMATSVSGDGQIVGGGSGYGTDKLRDQTAFVWDENHGTRSLPDILMQAGADLEGWQVSQTRDVSFDGSVMVGHGINSHGQQQAWWARLPQRVSEAGAIP